MSNSIGHAYKTLINDCKTLSIEKNKAIKSKSKGDIIEHKHSTI